MTEQGVLDAEAISRIVEFARSSGVKPLRLNGKPYYRLNIHPSNQDMVDEMVASGVLVRHETPDGPLLLFPKDT